MWATRIEEELKRIQQWRKSGRKTIVQIELPGLFPKVRAEDTREYFSNSAGMTLFDGIAIDEFGSDKPEYAPFYEDAVKNINGNKNYEEKHLYAYKYIILPFKSRY